MRLEATVGEKSSLVWLLAAVLLTIALPTDAQQPTEIPRIAFVGGSTHSGLSKRLEAFRQGLRELGYIEGRHRHRRSVLDSRGNKRNK